MDEMRREMRRDKVADSVFVTLHSQVVGWLAMPPHTSCELL